MRNIAIVIPTYNEAENISVLLFGIRQAVGSETKIIVVDDASHDGTADKARAADADVMVISRAGKLGLGSAYREGFAAAIARGAEVVVQMDADLSHDPKHLIDMLASAEDNDLVIGSRYVDGGAISGWSMWRHFCSRSAMAFARALLGLTTRDVTSGYRVWRGAMLKSVLDAGAQSNGYAFQEEMLYRAQRAGAKIVEVPIVFIDRQHGRSKLHIRDIIEFFFTMIRLRLS